MSTSYSDVPIGIRAIQRFSGNDIQPNRIIRYKTEKTKNEIQNKKTISMKIK